MQYLQKSQTVAIGLAMFSMFFGAGNIVFPLLVGQQAQDQTLFAILGLIVTAICVPFAGVIAMFLYEGNPLQFFSRLGRLPGIAIAASILALIGPFGGMPRCVTLAYSTIGDHIPSLTLPVYNVIATVIIFLCCFKKHRMLTVLGYFLTPILLVCLAAIGITGLMTGSGAMTLTPDPWNSFVFGLHEGYNTMDLLASFFFAGVVLRGIKHAQPSEQSPRATLWLALKASAIGAGLLSLIYVVFSLVAAQLGSDLADVPKDRLLSAVSSLVLGPYTGLIASLAMSLTCLTTAIALAGVFAEALQKHLFRNRISYVQALVITLGINFATSMLQFTVIIELLAPLLEVMYPGLIALTFVNIVWKLWPQKDQSLAMASTR